MLPLKLIQSCSLPLRSSVLASFVKPVTARSILTRKPQWIFFDGRKYLGSSHFLCTQIKKHDLSVKSVKSAEIFQEALEKKKKELKKRKQKLQENIRDKRSKVEEVFERENIFTIPNWLCMSRIAFSPYLGYTIIHGNYSIAVGLFIVAGLTDLADGYIARNWEGQKSNFGSFLDPLADKVLVTTLVLSMTYSNLFPLWLTSMIVFRDLVLIGAAFIIRFNSLPKEHRTLSKYFDATSVTAQLAPTFISKVNTVVQLFTIAVSLGAPIFDYGDHTLLHSLWYLTGATTAAAALSYCTERRNTYKYLRKDSDKSGLEK